MVKEQLKLAAISILDQAAHDKRYASIYDLNEIGQVFFNKKLTQIEIGQVCDALWAIDTNNEIYNIEWNRSAKRLTIVFWETESNEAEYRKPAHKEGLVSLESVLT